MIHVHFWFSFSFPLAKFVCGNADDEVFIDIIGKSPSIQIQAIRVSSREIEKMQNDCLGTLRCKYVVRPEVETASCPTDLRCSKRSL